MWKYECIVKRDGIVQKIIRYFTDSEHAFAWLELEGYKVYSIKVCRSEKFSKNQKGIMG